MRYIYCLIDPRTEEVRYVGKANNVKTRLQNHLCPANLSKSKHSSNWLSLLKREGLKPRVKTLQELEDMDDWEEAERKWIRLFRESGHNLTNITPGGEGGATYGRLGKPWTQQQRENYTKSRKGIPITPPSPEDCKKRGEAIREHWRLVKIAGGKKKGPVHTKESKAKLRVAHVGKILSKEHKKKLGYAKFSRTWSVKRQLLVLRRKRGG